ncbi:MAG: Unknown protein [uncultured Campylobacterales bacterium]|uniref:Uncharacterized protein n=1 Tax=uncultured Campylobacterales bacterium TaxID=352960 RepID=A0A6S6T811_9BACT|nr:MAG: Unknown protein [uncultured Campylobacterales bacterium]
MIRITILFCFIFGLLFGFKDFGTVGNTYEVKEKNFKEMMKEGYDKLDKKELRNNYKTMIENSFTKNSDLPESNITQKYTRENYVILDYDLKARMDGPVIKKAGEKIYPSFPLNQSQTICFIDAKERILLDPTIKALGSCDIYMISGADIREMYPNPLFAGKEVYPYDKNYKKRFNLKVLPTKVKIYDKYFDYTTIDMNIIKQKLRVKGDIL